MEKCERIMPARVHITKRGGWVLFRMVFLISLFPVAVLHNCIYLLLSTFYAYQIYSEPHASYQFNRINKNLRRAV